MTVVRAVSGTLFVSAGSGKLHEPWWLNVLGGLISWGGRQAARISKRNQPSDLLSANIRPTSKRSEPSDPLDKLSVASYPTSGWAVSYQGWVHRMTGATAGPGSLTFLARRRFAHGDFTIRTGGLM